MCCHSGDWLRVNYGHVKATGANKDRAGKFEAANGGYHLSDGIGDMSLNAHKGTRTSKKIRFNR
jgi:sigma54-dependent transcription regulator